MTQADIKGMYAEGNSTWEVLAAVIDAGVEFPDAEYKVSQALKLDAEERAEMVDKYSECS
jgi:hypothetical protein